MRLITLITFLLSIANFLSCSDRETKKGDAQVSTNSSIDGKLLDSEDSTTLETWPNVLQNFSPDGIIFAPYFFKSATEPGVNISIHPELDNNQVCALFDPQIDEKTISFWFFKLTVFQMKAGEYQIYPGTLTSSLDNNVSHLELWKVSAGKTEKSYVAIKGKVTIDSLPLNKDKFDKGTNLSGKIKAEFPLNPLQPKNCHAVGKIGPDGITVTSYDCECQQENGNNVTCNVPLETVDTPNYVNCCLQPNAANTIPFELSFNASPCGKACIGEFEFGASCNAYK